MGWFYGLVQQLPDDLPLVEREAVRVVLQDRCGRVLLFRARELTGPEPLLGAFANPQALSLYTSIPPAPPRRP